MSEQLMYWITRADDIKNALSSLTVLFCIIAVVCTFAFVISSIIITNMKMFRSKDWLEKDEDYNLNNTIQKYMSKALCVILPLLILVFCSNVFIPTTKDYVAIKVVPAIVNNEKLQNISHDFVDIAEQWLKDLKENKNIH